MSQKSWLSLLAFVGVLLCFSYLYLANKYCPVEQPGANLNWRLIPDLNENEEHERAAYRYGRQKNERHSFPSYALIQKLEAKNETKDSEAKGNIWLTKFFLRCQTL
jgi:hypothetical protein